MGFITRLPVCGTATDIDTARFNVRFPARCRHQHLDAVRRRMTQRRHSLRASSTPYSWICDKKALVVSDYLNARLRREPHRIRMLHRDGDRIRPIEIQGARQLTKLLEQPPTALAEGILNIKMGLFFPNPSGPGVCSLRRGVP